MDGYKHQECFTKIWNSAIFTFEFYTTYLQKSIANVPPEARRKKKNLIKATQRVFNIWTSFAAYNRNVCTILASARQNEAVKRGMKLQLSKRAVRSRQMGDVIAL